MRIAFFGMPGRFSAPVLRGALAAGAELAALLVPALPGAAPLAELPPARHPTSLIPMAGPPPADLLTIAAACGAPAFALSRDGAAAVSLLAELGVDLAGVACWPWRIPSALLATPAHGFLNTHPSLLPEGRGPEPLFWAFRSGAERGGVTIHAMDAGLDSGPIALQAGLELPAGTSGAEAELRAAKLGGALLGQALGLLGAGRLTLRAQGPGASVQPAPTTADFAIDPGWSARRAFGFMRGTAHWGLPYSLRLGGRERWLTEALAYSPADDPAWPAGVPVDAISVRLRPGTLYARQPGHG